MAKIPDNELEDYIYSYRIKVGQAIKKVREKRGFTQDELAIMMKINRSTISKIENGKFGITVDYLARFSTFLNLEFIIKEK